jgi:hypothetical protein
LAVVPGPEGFLRVPTDRALSPGVDSRGSSAAGKEENLDPSGSIDGGIILAEPVDMVPRDPGCITGSAFVCIPGIVVAVRRSPTERVDRPDTMRGGDFSTDGEPSWNLACTNEDRSERSLLTAVGQRRLTSVSSGRRSVPKPAARARMPEATDPEITPGGAL